MLTCMLFFIKKILLDVKKWVADPYTKQVRN